MAQSDVLKAFEGHEFMTFKEISAKTNINPHTLRKNIRRMIITDTIERPKRGSKRVTYTLK